MKLAINRGLSLLMLGLCLWFVWPNETQAADLKLAFEQIRLRDFEVPMSGGFYLVEHQEELREFFEIGREIETYRSREELLDKISFYLGHDAERERIRRAGRERCLRDHTWQRRFDAAFREIGLSGPTHSGGDAVRREH